MQTDAQYPQIVPLKVMGDTGAELLEVLRRVLAHHLNAGTPIDLDSQPSRTGKYTSYTATFKAESHEQLRAIYADLRKADCVRFLL